jgi:hypothetical protein
MGKRVNNKVFGIKMFNFWKRGENEVEVEDDDIMSIVDCMNEFREDIRRLYVLVEMMNDTLIKSWRAEDVEENGGNFRWPFDTNGNLLDNVTTSGYSESGDIE